MNTINYILDFKNEIVSSELNEYDFGLSLQIDKESFSIKFENEALNGEVSNTSLDASLYLENEVLDTSFEFEYSHGEDAYYEGDYVIIPKAYEKQVLETKNKRMYDDITVKKVPYFETSNDDGETVYIASGV